MKEQVDWDLFTPILEDIFDPPRTRGPGRRPWDYLVIFRSLLLGVSIPIGYWSIPQQKNWLFSFLDWLVLTTSFPVSLTPSLPWWRRMLSLCDVLDLQGWDPLRHHLAGHRTRGPPTVT